MIRISESVTIPSAAIIVASTMKARKLAESSALSEVWSSTVSQTTASAGEPTATSSARRAASETSAEIGSSAIEPVPVEPELAQLGDDEAGVLARDVAEDEVAGGPLGRALEPDEVQRGRMLAQERCAGSASSGGATTRRWITASYSRTKR